MEARESSRPSKPSDSMVWVLQTKVDILTDSLGDIKDTIKRIEEMVGVIRIIEVNSKQLSKDTEALAGTVSSLQSKVTELERSIKEALEKSEDRNEEDLKNVAKDLATFRTAWTEKWNVARGMWIVISAVFLTLSSSSLLFIRAQNTKLEDAYTWIEREKIERSVKDTREQRSAEYAKDFPAATGPQGKDGESPQYRLSPVTTAPTARLRQGNATSGSSVNR